MSEPFRVVQRVRDAMVDLLDELSDHLPEEWERMCREAGGTPLGVPTVKREDNLTYGKDITLPDGTVVTDSVRYLLVATGPASRD